MTTYYASPIVPAAVPAPTVTVVPSVPEHDRVGAPRVVVVTVPAAPIVPPARS
jgi:hypothetical protein